MLNGLPVTHMNKLSARLFVERMSKSTINPGDANPYPHWAPRFWHGMLFTDWIRLLVKHRCRVHPARWGLAVTTTFVSLFNSNMRVAQTALWDTAFAIHRCRTTLSLCLAIGEVVRHCCMNCYLLTIALRRPRLISALRQTTSC